MNKKERIRVFSYGSNMSSKRLLARIDSAIFLGIGYIMEHELRFHKISKDGSGKADTYFTGNKKDIIWGVISEIAKKDKKILDKYEGLGFGYAEKEVNVILPIGESVKSILYYAIRIDEKNEILPYKWYVDYLIAGAIEFEFPKSYIKDLKQIDFKHDLNEERREKNNQTIES